MPIPFQMPLIQIQPSQLYISQTKLSRVLEAISLSTFGELDPIPIKQLGEHIIFTDGHTRAYAAYLAKLSTVTVCWDQDALDWEAYEICVSWCLKAGIRTIADLHARVIPDKMYETHWLQRCAIMQEGLKKKRRTHDKDTHPQN